MLIQNHFQDKKVLFYYFCSEQFTTTKKKIQKFYVQPPDKVIFS